MIRCNSGLICPSSHFSLVFNAMPHMTMTFLTYVKPFLSCCAFTSAPALAAKRRKKDFWGLGGGLLQSRSQIKLVKACSRSIFDASVFYVLDDKRIARLVQSHCIRKEKFNCSWNVFVKSDNFFIKAVTGVIVHEPMTHFIMRNLFDDSWFAQPFLHNSCVHPSPQHTAIRYTGNTIRNSSDRVASCFVLEYH